MLIKILLFIFYVFVLKIAHKHIAKLCYYSQKSTVLEAAK